MTSRDLHLSETDIRNPAGQFWTVRADTADRRAWLAEASVCPLLKQYQISHLGVVRTPAPFEIVRSNLRGSYFLACFGGRGRVLIDGRWQPCGAGAAFLLQPRTRHAFHAEQDHHWEFCWVRYQEQAGQQPIASVNSPILAQFDVEPLRLAVMGLHHESSHTSIPATLDHWVQLIQRYVGGFIKSRRVDPRIWDLWEKVSADLTHAWTSAQLAREVHLSEKQLERVCRRELGRTPRQHLIWLRMQRAAELLTTQGGKIESIASQVGYQNPFVFSATFKRCMGWPPSEYPGRKKQSSST
ncbi:MAG TPA: AraC family transcriptional regulator [Planctomycetaceae bacterium]|nr:AraC family transcriptional regulator [Blastopirellula sp.]HAY82145.1 AraC family transcriptional regulator [Planctomycetaceae bacterium]